jgi:hypothetical protein
MKIILDWFTPQAEGNWAKIRTSDPAIGRLLRPPSSFRRGAGLFQSTIPTPASADAISPEALTAVTDNLSSEEACLLAAAKKSDISDKFG